MSDHMRIAAVMEGPTDGLVLRAVLEALLAGTEFEFHTLQPEESAAFRATAYGNTGVGWTGVYRWSRESKEEGGGSVSGSVVFDHYDLLIVHIDADVASRTYASAGIANAPRDDLPCAEPCPPPSDTTNALRAVVLNWLGETSCPPRLVFCTPSMNMEAWVVALVWPDNALVRRRDWECRSDPGGQLRTLPLGARFRKTTYDYREKQRDFSTGWPNVAATLTEAERFEREFLAAVPADPVPSSVTP